MPPLRLPGAFFSASVTVIRIRIPKTAQEADMCALNNFPRISPFLWFDSNAEEAVEFYLSVFKNSSRLGELRNTGDAPGFKGSILTISFELEGQKFTALNGGPAHAFTDAISFVVRCDSQQEAATRCSVLIDTRLIDIRGPQRATGARASVVMIEYDRILAQ